MNNVFYLKYGTSNHNTLEPLGELQASHNLSFVIDGTKDSAKIEVISFDIDEEIKPYTIINLSDTNTWWIVSNDKVEYYVNESSYLYKHSLKLVGLIELLNARDLTDCGFYGKNYTISQFINRLWKLSNIEFQLLLETGNSLDLNKTIDYTKSFENYTLLSALRELLDGYNFSVKARLIKIGNWWDKMIISFVSKTGVGTNVLNENVFQSVKQTRTIDKESYGTTVVSNAENVISTKAKTFPSVGSIRLSSTSLQITRDNAVLRLPTNIYKVNYLKMITPLTFTFYDNISGTTEHPKITLFNYDINVLKTEITNFINSLSPLQIYDEQREELLEHIDEIARNASLSMQVTLKTGWSYNPINQTYIKPQNDDSFYFPQIHLSKTYPAPEYVYEGHWLLGQKLDHDTAPYPIGMIYYEQGKDTLENFKVLGDIGNEYSSYLMNNSNDYGNPLGNSKLYEANTWDVRYNAFQQLDPSNVSFIVNYIPMSDLKVKYDNSMENRDIKLYNQNGKLNDSVALSKLILSYSKEIESDNITRFGVYYDYNNVPKVGSMVLINNSVYVINNVSLDFYENEDSENNYGLYIVGEFTLSKKIATKSLMVNPNNNIRDYGIPQNMNVKRKQLYRDFYELAHDIDTSSSVDYYLPLSNYFNLGLMSVSSKEHVAVMKLQYDSAYGGDSNNNIPSSDTWYYQLDTTTFIMKKAIYEVLDFKDNNIIGYGSQNVSSGFQVSRIISGMTDTINTPISYVDDYGKVKNIDICFCNIDQIQEIYDQYKEDVGFTRNISLYNYSVFIPQDIYDLAYNDSSNRDFVISETNYNKDPIEVPVFEYSCQVDDSDDVIVGDNVFDINLNDTSVKVIKFYMYTYVLAPKNSINENNFGALDINNVEVDLNIRPYKINDSVKLEFIANSSISIKLYGLARTLYGLETTYYSEVTISSIDWTKYDLVIIRKNIEYDNNVTPPVLRQNNDLLFVIKNMENASIADNTLTLTINHYKIK